MNFVYRPSYFFFVRSSQVESDSELLEAIKLTTEAERILPGEGFGNPPFSMGVFVHFHVIKKQKAVDCSQHTEGIDLQEEGPSRDLRIMHSRLLQRQSHKYPLQSSDHSSLY